MTLVRRKYYRLGKHAGELLLGFLAAVIEFGVRVITGGRVCVRSVAVRIVRGHRVERTRTQHDEPSPEQETEQSALACRALQRLGFTKQEAHRRVVAVLQSVDSEPALEEIVRSALSRA